jgi:hypothetical protein
MIFGRRIFMAYTMLDRSGWLFQTAGGEIACNILADSPTNKGGRTRQAIASPAKCRYLIIPSQFKFLEFPDNGSCPCRDNTEGDGGQNDCGNSEYHGNSR